MHADMTAVTIQSNKIVLNEVKNNSALLAPSHGKNEVNSLANPVVQNTKFREVKLLVQGWIMFSFYVSSGTLRFLPLGSII